MAVSVSLTVASTDFCGVVFSSTLVGRGLLGTCISTVILFSLFSLSLSLSLCFLFKFSFSLLFCATVGTVVS